MKKNNNRRFGVESLERRDLMAGNVTVNLVNSPDGVDVSVVGDNASNAIEVYQPTLDTYRVVGRNAGGAPTKINGVTGGSFTFTLQRFSDDIKIDMNGGDDSVVIRGGSSEYFDIDAHGSLLIDVGTGNDTVDLSYVQAEDDIEIRLGTGRDTVRVFEAEAGDDFIIGTSHTSRTAQAVLIALDNVYAGDDLDIDLRYSLDRVNITDTSARDFKVNLWSGDDKLNIKRSTARVSSLLDGGDGNDSLNLYANNPYSFKYQEFLKPTRNSSTMF